MKSDEISRENYIGDVSHFNDIIKYLEDENNFIEGKFIAFDSQIGTGKTFFLELLKKELFNYIKNEKSVSNQKKPIIIHYDLSEYDAGNYAIMFFHVLYEQLNAIEDSDKQYLENFMKKTSKLFGNIILNDEKQIKYIGDVISISKDLYNYKKLKNKYTKDRKYNKSLVELSNIKNLLDELIENRYILIFLDNTDRCNEMFFYNTIALIRNFLSMITDKKIKTKYGVFVFLDNQQVKDIYQENVISKTSVIRILNDMYAKRITFPKLNYKKAISILSNEVFKQDYLIPLFCNDELQVNGIIKSNNICKCLLQYVNYYQPSIAILRQFLNNLGKYFEKNLIKTENDLLYIDQNFCCSIMFISLLKYCDYDVYRSLRIEYPDNGNNKTVKTYVTREMKSALNYKDSFKNVPELQNSHRLFNKYGTFEYIELNDLVEVEIKNFQNIGILVTKYKDKTGKLYTIDSFSTIDHIIRYEDFEQLVDIIEMSAFDIINRYCSII